MMNGTARAMDGPRLDGGHPLIVGSAVVTMAVVGLAMKATAGMRGQTLGELVRGTEPGRVTPRPSRDAGLHLVRPEPAQRRVSFAR